MKPALVRLLVAGAIVMAPAAALAPSASAATPAASATTTVSFACEGSTPLGPQDFTFTQDATVTAPDTVAAGGALAVGIDAAPNTVPASVNGFTVKQITDLALKIPVPANSDYVSATLDGGSGAGTTAISEADGIATLTASGPIAGGAAFELPTVTANLTAGSSGSIQTQLYGTSYADPGLTFTASVSSILGDITVPTTCYPSPNPVITTTTIG